MEQQLFAGDSLNFVTSVTDYLASDGWTLKYRLVPRAAGAAYELTAVAEGDGYRVQVSATTTAAWVAGKYSWVSWVEKGAESYTVEKGQIEIAPNLRSATTADTRSQAEQALDAIRLTLQGKATTGMQSYQIEGRQLSSYSIAELIMLEGRYQLEVNRERRAAGLSVGGSKILARFAR